MAFISLLIDLHGSCHGNFKKMLNKINKNNNGTKHDDFLAIAESERYTLRVSKLKFGIHCISMKMYHYFLNNALSIE